MENTTKEDVFEKGIEILDTLREYFFELLSRLEISAKTYTRVVAGIDSLKNNLINNNNGIPEFEYDLSLADLNVIIQQSKMVQVDSKNLPVAPYISYEEDLLKETLKDVFNNSKYELNKEDIDKLLEKIDKIDEVINENQ